MKTTLLSLITITSVLSATAQQTAHPNPTPLLQTPQQQRLNAEQRANALLKNLTLEEKVQLMMDTSPAIDRLQIPQFQWWNEALHGVGRNGYATVFPITRACRSGHQTLIFSVIRAGGVVRKPTARIHSLRRRWGRSKSISNKNQ